MPCMRKKPSTFGKDVFATTNKSSLRNNGSKENAARNNNQRLIKKPANSRQ